MCNIHNIIIVQTIDRIKKQKMKLDLRITIKQKLKRVEQEKNEGIL